MVENRLDRCDTLNIAHRGARSLAPENTLAAAEAGLAAKADMWELDVQITADGELILLHDDDLKRTSNVEAIFPTRRPWHVASFTLAEIRQLDFGSWYTETDPFGEIRAGHVSAAAQQSFVLAAAPTLREALEWTRAHQWRVNVELKNLRGAAGEDTFVERVITLVEELGMEEQVLISSFNHDYVRRAKVANPHIRAGALTGRAMRDVAQYIRELGADAYNPHVSAITPAEIRALRAEGIDVYVYTVNDEETMWELVRAGVSGIFTDYPQRLTPILETCR